MSDSIETRISEVVTAHQRHTTRTCLCGWGELGRSHSDHVAREVVAALGLAEFAVGEEHWWSTRIWERTE